MKAMKATLSTPNTLFLALFTKAPGSILLGTLRTITEPVQVMEDKAKDGVELLAFGLRDAKALAAEHLVIYTNDAQVLGLYRPPIRLEPTSAQRQHLYVPLQWEILRLFCLYMTWQVIETNALPNAKKLWEATYAH